MDTTASVLGGRLAHKAALAPLRLPLVDTALTDSPKRMRTTPNGSWLSTTPTGGAPAAWHARAEAFAAAGRLAKPSPRAARPSPLARETSASTEATLSPTGSCGASPSRAVTGTEEPGMARGAAACATTETKELGAASPFMVMLDGDAFTLADFSDLFGAESAEAYVPVSCGKRKAAREWM